MESERERDSELESRSIAELLAVPVPEQID